MSDEAGYPWSLLRLSSEADAAELRRAFARKLRATRPEDDPAGFQVLVEARDRALALIEQRERIDVRSVTAPGSLSEEIRPGPLADAPVLVEPTPTAVAQAHGVNFPDLLERITMLRRVRDVETFNHQWSGIIAALQMLPPISLGVLEPTIVDLLGGALLDWLPPDGRTLDVDTIRTLSSLGRLFEWDRAYGHLMELLQRYRFNYWIAGILEKGGENYTPRPILQPASARPSVESKPRSSPMARRLLLVVIFALIIAARLFLDSSHPSYAPRVDTDALQRMLDDICKKEPANDSCQDRK